MNHSISQLAQCGFQLFILLLARLVIRPFTSINSAPVHPEFIKHHGYLIAANHRRAFDAFVICSSMPFGMIFKILPIGFMIHNTFYDSPLKPLLWLSGGYPARDPRGEHKHFGVAGSLHLLKRGFSIFIFPEGARVRDKTRGEAHWGIIRIHQAAPQMPIILAHIEYRPGLKNLLYGCRQSVHFNLIKNPKFTNPEAIMDAIFALK